MPVLFFASTRALSAASISAVREPAPAIAAAPVIAMAARTIRFAPRPISSPPRVDRRANRADALRDARARRVDDHAIATPRSVVAIDDFLPFGQTQPRHVRRPRLDAASVLDGIGAEDLDLQGGDSGAIRDAAPRGARERPRVDAISNDVVPEPQVVPGDRIGGAIAGVLDGLAGVAQRLLDRVDPHVDRAELARQLAGNRRLAH